MKFAAVVVMFAFAAVVECGGVLPYLGGHPLSYTAVSGPALVHSAAHVPAAVSYSSVAHHATPLAYAAHAAPLAYAAHAAPLAYAAHGLAHHAYAAPIAVAHAAPVALAHEGTYVAKTRGAEHVAPLPGHLNSAASINLQPAPGTW